MMRRDSLFDTDTFNGRLFFPRRGATRPPPGAVDLDVPVPGATLHLRWHAAPTARAAVLLFHGNGEIVADYDDSAPMFAGAGADLAVVDFRGYGRSSGTPSLRDTIADAAPSLAALAARCPKPIVVMGRSLGAACAAELYGTPAGAAARAFILESGFTDLEALVERRGLSSAPITPEDRRDFDPLPKLQRGRHPLLVLHGAADDLIVPAEGSAAFAAAAAPEDRKRLVLVPHRGHNDVSSSPVYWEALRAFLDEVMGGPAPP